MTCWKSMEVIHFYSQPQVAITGTEGFWRLSVCSFFQPIAYNSPINLYMNRLSFALEANVLISKYACAHFKKYLFPFYWKL